MQCLCALPAINKTLEIPIDLWFYGINFIHSQLPRTQAGPKYIKELKDIVFLVQTARWMFQVTKTGWLICYKYEMKICNQKLQENHTLLIILKCK